MKNTHRFLGIAAALIVSFGVHTVHAQEKYTSLKEAIDSMSGEIQSCKDHVEGQDEYIADLEARLKSMTDSAASLKSQLQQADDDYTACVGEEDETQEDNTSGIVCNAIASIFGLKCSDYYRVRSNVLRTK
jgi:septal ring factor EnvC (AmiA/AmiB activator)